MTPKLCVKNYHLEWLYLAAQLQSNLPRSLRLIRLILTLTGHSALLDVIFAGYHHIMPLLDLRPFHEANFEAVPNNGRTGRCQSYCSRVTPPWPMPNRFGSDLTSISPSSEMAKNCYKYCMMTLTLLRAGRESRSRGWLSDRSTA